MSFEIEIPVVVCSYVWWSFVPLYTEEDTNLRYHACIKSWSFFYDSFVTVVSLNPYRTNVENRVSS